MFLLGLNFSFGSEQTDEKQINLETRLKRAHLFYKENKFSETIKLLTPVVEILPSKGLHLIADSYCALENFNRCTQILNSILASNDKDYFAHTKKGYALLKQSKFDESAQAFRKAILINKQHQPAYLGLLDLFNQNKKNNPRSGYERRAILQDMIKAFGEKAEYFNQLCKLYFEDSFLQDTINTCKIAINKNPNYPDNHLYLGRALINVGQVTTGNKTIKMAARRFEKSEIAQETAGEISKQAQNHIMAYQYFLKCIKYNPEAQKCHLGLAQSAFELDKLEESLKAFIASCKLNKQEIHEFKTAAAKLRKENRYDWYQKFNQSIDLCLK